jgi:hypothetical protein
VEDKIQDRGEAVAESAVEQSPIGICRDREAVRDANAGRAELAVEFAQ